MTTKCYGCGLVNALGATVCGRCDGRLGARPAKTLNPFEGEAPKTFSGFRLGLMLFFALVVSFGAYQALKPDVQVVKKLAPAEVEQQARIQEALLKQAEMDRQIKESDRLNAARLYQQPGLSRTQYDRPSSMKRAWDPVADQPRPGSGGYQIAPPGTTYVYDGSGRFVGVR